MDTGLDRRGNNFLGDVSSPSLDIAANDRAIAMANLKAVPVGIARSLLKGGQHAINSAQSEAKQPWYAVEMNLPGVTSRANCAAHLQWHQDALGKLSNDKAIYQSGDDLKKWVLQAFAEWDAVKEGTQQLKDAWHAMWKEIGENIENLVPQTVPSLVPWWVWLLVGGAVTTGLGIYIYKSVYIPKKNRELYE